MKNVLVYAVNWVGLVILAIINGIIRTKGYGRSMSELAAHQLSTIIGICLFGIYIWAITLIWKIESAGQAITIGLMWLVMTIVFEFVFGHYMVGHPWSRLFLDYNILKGRLWVLVLLWTAIAPYIFYKVRS